MKGQCMQCPQCQQENPAGARFCNACGARLEALCAGCGQVNPLGHRFCNACGQNLAPPVSTAPAPRFAAPQVYTPQHLAEKILTSRPALEGERKQVTVLFADLKDSTDSTELIKDLDPEAAQQLLDPAIHHMMDAVHRFEGTVNQVLGDGIMALFGAPIAHEDHALRACYAALAMQDTMRDYAEEIRHTHGLALRLCVGLNAEEVVVRTIGNDLHMDYSAMGQTVHVCRGECLGRGRRPHSRGGRTSL
jgi:class 3 adenylate cyclase